MKFPYMISSLIGGLLIGVAVKDTTFFYFLCGLVGYLLTQVTFYEMGKEESGPRELEGK